MNAAKIWDKLFLVEQPSLVLAFFRLFAAVTVGAHVIPSFFCLDESFLSRALKSYNTNFFPVDLLRFVAQSPDILVQWCVVGFIVSWFFFLIGYRTQLSGILMTMLCYYFYALNSFHIGTLSWDILLVTLTLLCVTSYPGDYFSVDALRRMDVKAWQKTRPFFIQRLLQVQIAMTYFYTGLYKIWPQGNWITGNPIHILMNYPQTGVTKNFLIRDWLAGQPQVCYWIGVTVVLIELLMPLLLWCKRTRQSAIILGFIFHLTLILTLDVPSIFFFLFPAQLLLFIDPQEVMAWVNRRRQRFVPLKVVYDGQCGFCKRWVKRLMIMDLWGRLTFEPAQENLHEIKVYDADKVYGGYDALRRLCFVLPMMMPLLLFAYLPGMGFVGGQVYRLVAQLRGLGGCRQESCRL